MNIFEGLSHFAIGIAAVFSAYFPATSVLTEPQIFGISQKEIHSNIITRTGEYTYNGQTLKYRVNIPLDGGNIEGNFSGVCHGTISGYYKGSPSYAIDNGEAKATCPILLNKKLTATYVTHLDLEKGKAYIDWKGDIPYTSGIGSFTVDFEPVN